MKRISPRWRRAACTLALVAVAATATAQGRNNRPPPQGNHGGKASGDESWQIEQRKRWFLETRGLDTTGDAGVRRANAIRQLKQQTRVRAMNDIESGEVWTPIGPSSMKMGQWAMGRVAGRVNVIAPHPADDNTVYIGSASGGVWKTVNAGASWTSTLDAVGNYSVGSIFIEPGAPENVWVGTGDKIGDCAGYLSHGVFHSTDGGASWTARNGSGSSALPLKLVNSLVVLPSNANVIIAGGGGSCGSATGGTSGIYRSADRGATWTQVFTAKVEDMVVVPGTSTVYAAAPGYGVYKSTDGGATWANTGLSSSGTRLRLALSASDPYTLYTFNGTNVHRSSDGGASWGLRSSSACNGQCSYNLALAVHPTTPSTVIAASIRPARSIDGGASYSIMTNQWGSSQQVHQDTHAVIYSKNNPSRIWVGGDGGLWRTDNGGSSWINMNSNLSLTQYYDIAVHPTNTDIVWGGAQDNSSSGRFDNTNVWDLTVATGDGFMNLVDDTNPNLVFQTSYPNGSTPSIYRSTQAGAAGTFGSWGTSGVSGTFPWKTPLAIAGGQVFVGSNRVFRASSAGSGSWSAVSGVLSNTASVITPMRRNGATPMYVGTKDGSIYYTADASTGSSMSNVTGNYPGGFVGDIAIDPANPARVFVARSGFGYARLYRSTSSGTTWSAVGAGLPDVPANAVSIDPLDSNRIFVGTDVGTYVSTDGGDTFTAFSTGMPMGALVTDLEIDNSPYVLTAGTYGRGAWKVPLGGNSGNNPPVANFGVVTNGLTANFTDTSSDSDGSIAFRNWNFGDGTNSAEANPVKTYASAGNYTVTLTATDNEGAVDTETRVVTVNATNDGILSNGVPVTGLSGAADSQQRWTMEVPAGSANLKFVTAGSNGDADLYVNLGSPASKTDYDCKSDGPDSHETCLIASPQAGTWHVLIQPYSAFSGLSLTGSYGTGLQTYRNDTDVAIDDNATVSSAVTVSGRSGNAPSATQVSVDIRHTYIGDLKVDLVAPDGSVYVLHNRSGGSADDILKAYTVNLSGEALNGTWQLRVNDNAANDTGYINSWSITF